MSARTHGVRSRPSSILAPCVVPRGATIRQTGDRLTAATPHCPPEWNPGHLRSEEVRQLRIVRSSQEQSSRPNVIAATASGSRPRLMGPNGLFAWGGSIRIETDSLGVAAPKSVGCHDGDGLAVDWTQDLIDGVNHAVPSPQPDPRRSGERVISRDKETLGEGRPVSDR